MHDIITYSYSISMTLENKLMNEESFLQSILPFSHLDSNAFKIALYEMSHGTLIYNSNRIESLLYNPIDQPE